MPTMMMGLLTGGISSGGGGGASPISFVGRSQAAVSSHIVTYASAPVACGASDIIVVGIVGENGAVADSVSGVTVGGVSLTQYTPGNLRNDLVVVGYSSIFYGVPGAFSTANIVATNTGSAGGTIVIMAWKLVGLNSTPVSQLGSSTANSTSMAIGSIHTASGGAVIAIYAGQPHKTITEAWSGSETLVEDSNAVDPSGNEDAVGCSVATTATGTTATLTFTASAAAQHCGGVISFGP
jgi:hypothetical protein